MRLQMFLTPILYLLVVAKASPIDIYGEDVKMKTLTEIQGSMALLPIISERGCLKESYKHLAVSSPRKNKTRRLFNRLERFLKNLKSFVSIAGFDIKGFEKMSMKLCRYLSKIDARIEKVPHSFEMCEQFANAKHIFRSMMQAMTDMKKYDSSDTALHLVGCAIQLNIMLFALHDSQGYPDPTIQDYSATVNRLISVLYTWSDIFKNLADVPSELNVLFYNQLARADDTLANLAKYSSS